MRFVNEKGLKEIHEFLVTHHRLGRLARDHLEPMLGAWAGEAENHMGCGNPPTVEIRSRDSVSGHTEVLTISESGISEDENFFGEQDDAS